MKRTTKVSATEDRGKVEITITSNITGLTRDELNGLQNQLAEAAMHSLSSARYFRVPLSKVKVSG